MFSPDSSPLFKAESLYIEAERLVYHLLNLPHVMRFYGSDKRIYERAINRRDRRYRMLMTTIEIQVQEEYADIGVLGFADFEQCGCVVTTHTLSHG